MRPPAPSGSQQRNAGALPSMRPPSPCFAGRSHSGGLTGLAARLNSEGFAAVGVDFPGHGRSGATHPCGRAFDSDPFAWIDDLETVLNNTADALVPAGTPIFLYGESIGGATLLQLLLRPAAAGRVAGGVTVGATGGMRLRQFLPAVAAVLPLGRALARAVPQWWLPLPRSAFRFVFARQFGDDAVGRRVFDTDP
jgi:alpha-beta hydrolase superfamily lysophospholipase